MQSIKQQTCVQALRSKLEEEKALAEASALKVLMQEDLCKRISSDGQQVNIFAPVLCLQ